MGLILSTSWNAFRCGNGKILLSEIRDLGFEEIELSFNLSAGVLEDIRKAVKSGQAKVRSAHNFCPIPDGITQEEALPDCYSLSSPQEKIRQLAIKYTKRSIDTAQALGAKAVVLHCGRIDARDRTRDLINLYEKGQKGSEEFKVLKEKMTEERKVLRTPFFENTLKSLKELNHYAEEKDVSLGIETRFYYYEIPSLEEIGIILDSFRNSRVFYWHDVGHAQVMENLGFNTHKAYLDMYSGSLIGIHLHDVSLGSDHRAVNKGEFNFNCLMPYLKKETLKVVEIHHPATSEDIKESRQSLTKIFNGII